YVHGKPIHETDFARDPEYPRISPEVLQLVGARRHSFDLHYCRPDDPLPASGIIIGEIANAHGLQRWAQRSTSGMLLAGGAEFFSTLLAVRGFNRMKPDSNQAEVLSGPQLFVCGTTSDSALWFVHSAREKGTPVLALPPELADGGQFEPA